jgi:trans-2,3-dihydro-3-hydroxyanthranilate isomerase
LRPRSLVRRPSRNIFRPNRATGILLYVRDGRDGVDIRARMFAPLYGVPDDPATGSANCTLAGLLASCPSMLEATAEKSGGRITELRIGGRCVAMMRGVLEL